MSTWGLDKPGPQIAPFGMMGWLRAIVRGAVLIPILVAGLILKLLVRLVEAPLHGMRRPWTPYITQVVCIAALRIIGIERRQAGQPDPQAGAVVANHSSWLDIFALNAGQRVFFVAKAEVAGWPGIGWLARATGTLFIRRNRQEAQLHVAQFAERLKAGQQLLFFPEGTSTDGQQVVPFKPTLFAAFYDPAMPDDMRIQPVSVVYHAAEGAHPAQYGWWGDMAFGPHLLAMLAARQHGSVEVIYHDPIRIAAAGGRKALAAQLHEKVAEGLAARKA